MKKTLIITGMVFVLASIALTAFVRLTSERENKIQNLAEVKEGNFEISVSGTGELIAENSIDIKGPDVVHNMFFRPSGLKITDIVPEGTIVRKGDYIATLDRSAFENTLKDEITNLKQVEADYEMKLLDTAVVLSTIRDDIINQKYAVEEAEITVEQSKYEPPAIQQEEQLKYEREQRNLEQKKRIYLLQLAQTSADARILRNSLVKQHMKVQAISDVLKDFTVMSPADGMVVYKSDRMGTKIKAGSVVFPFDPVVATLPDLSSLVSKVYVSEIDVNKIKKEEPVQVTIDAFPGKSFTGSVSSISNIGELLPNSDSKVFELLVKLDGSDPFLRPSMTTGNKVIIKTYNNVVYIPIECVLTGADNIPYVYTSKKIKQVVIPGESNDKNVIIEKGLAVGTSVFRTLPDNYKKFTVAGNDLINVLREREKSNISEATGPTKRSTLMAGKAP